MSEFAWLPEDAPATRMFNPSKAAIGMEQVPCWMGPQFSIFFDGTRNHLMEDKASESHSNVARLFDTCKHKPTNGQFRLYVQGVGTPFPDIGEDEPHADGAKSGANGDLRLRYAFLYMANELARILTGDVIVAETIADTSAAVQDKAQVNVWRRKLEQMLANPKPGAPEIPMITLDLFGFSRGAAAARAFLNHLTEWTGGGHAQVCGIPLRVRFMGLFDRVASVELADSYPFLVDGHMGWAKPEYMIIPHFVEQCVHMVAGHEARNSFPLTTIGVERDNARPRIEIVYPGVHADVGGRYGAVAQGKGTHLGDQRARQNQHDMLSQIPLNDMYGRACMAAVPLMPRKDLPRALLSENSEQLSEMSAHAWAPEDARASRTLNTSKASSVGGRAPHCSHFQVSIWPKGAHLKNIERETSCAHPVIKRWRCCRRRVLYAPALIAVVFTMIGCKPAEQDSDPNARVGGSLTSMDHEPTDTYVEVVYVNGRGGDSASTGGSTVLSATSLPQRWHPGLVVHVKWRRCRAYHPERPETEAEACRWVEKDVSVHPYTYVGRTWLHIFANDEALVIPAMLGPNHPDYPGAEFPKKNFDERQGIGKDE